MLPTDFHFPVHRRRVLAVVLACLVVAVLLLRHHGSGGGGLPPAGALQVAPVVESGGADSSAGATVAKPAPLVVDVVGAVRRPGLYHLRTGARVADAVASAGGLTRHADVELVNLAARVADGEQVLVAARGAAGAGADAGATGGEPAAPVSLSTASAEQLDTLPGVGPVTAQKIVDFRQQHGPFTSVEGLDAISGIGPARIAALKGLVVP